MIKNFLFSLVFISTLIFCLRVIENTRVEPKVFDKLLNGNVSVMVTFKDQLNDVFLDHIASYPVSERGKVLYNFLTNLALNSQRDVVDFLNSVDVLYKRHYLINAIFVQSAGEEVVKKLSKFNEIDRIFLISNVTEVTHTTGVTSLSGINNNSSLGGKQQLPPVEYPPQVSVEPNISYIGADKVWEEFTDGEGIVVASQDTGADWSHGALVDQYRGSTGDKPQHDFNWHDAVEHSLISYAENNPCGYSSSIPCDDLSHGTHVLGIAVGSDGTNFTGVAPGASWIACRNKDMGVGNLSTYLGCFEFFFAPYKVGGDHMTDGDPSKAPHIINNSWSCPGTEGCFQDELLDVLKILKTAGIFVVVSAGNSGPGCSSIESSPAWHTDHSFSVGAIFYVTDEIWHLSSRGPSSYTNKVAPHIVAPGMNIRSSLSNGLFGDDWYGTSMATPHVAGAIALVWSANKSLIGQVDKTAQILMDTATPKFARVVCGNNKNKIPNNTYGHGILDVYRAVQLAISNF